MQFYSRPTKLLVLASGLWGAAALADGLRCGGAIVQIGDKKMDVEDKCGAPAMKDTYCRPIEPSKRVAPDATTHLKQAYCENVDAWTYRRGAGEFRVTVEFE